MKPHDLKPHHFEAALKHAEVTKFSDVSPSEVQQFAGRIHEGVMQRMEQSQQRGV